MTTDNSSEHYLKDATYAGLVDAILNAEPCAWSGKVEKDQIMIALGEVGDIWPAVIEKNRNHPLISGYGVSYT